jgi:hypothetical protein
VVLPSPSPSFLLPLPLPPPSFSSFGGHRPAPAGAGTGGPSFGWVRAAARRKLSFFGRRSVRAAIRNRGGLRGSERSAKVGTQRRSGQAALSFPLPGTQSRTKGFGFGTAVKDALVCSRFEVGSLSSKDGPRGLVKF